MAMKLLLTMALTLTVMFGLLFGIVAAFGYYYGLSWSWVVILALVIVLLQWAVGPRIIWWTTNMRLLERDEYPWLQQSIVEICRKNKVPVPRIAIVRSGGPNAFVFGRTPSSATLAVTAGLLKSLTNDEVKAVVAHEIGHIKHMDMIVMTAVSAIPVIAYYIARFSVFAPSKNDRKQSGSAILVGVAAFLVYFITNLLVLSLSRLREYYSDRFAGENVNPVFLANALAKITYGLSISDKGENVAVRSFYIADPMTSKMDVSMLRESHMKLDLNEKEIESAMKWEKSNLFMRIGEIFRTHPLTYKRIQALLEMRDR